MTEIKNITVVGAGQMGAGIGLLSAIYGYNVTFNDIKQEFIDGGLGKNFKYLDKRAAKGKMDQATVDEIKARMKGEIDLKVAVKDADLVIEAIIENLDIKKKTWATIGEAAPEHCLFGSNTSSLSISEMGKASGRPTKFLGVHFFNPPVVLKLIEFIRGDDTSQETVDKAMEYGKSMEMNTVLVKKETPGFIVNKLLVPQLNSAIKLLEDGIATKEDIDTAMKVGLAHPMGPLTLSDFIGLDTVLFIGKYLEEQLGDYYKVPELLKKLVDEGKLGRKTGEGFYKY